MHLSATTVTVVSTIFVPLVTGLVTHLHAPAWVKQVTNIVIAAAASVIASATLADGTAVLSQQTLINAAVGIGTSIIAYLGFWQGTNVSQVLAPNSGIGAPAPEPPPAPTWPLTADESTQLQALLSKLASK